MEVKPNKNMPEMQGLTPEQMKAAQVYVRQHIYRTPLTYIGIALGIVCFIYLRGLLIGYIDSRTIASAIAGGAGGLLLGLCNVPVSRMLIRKWRREKHI